MAESRIELFSHVSDRHTIPGFRTSSMAWSSSNFGASDRTFAIIVSGIVEMDSGRRSGLSTVFVIVVLTSDFSLAFRLDRLGLRIPRSFNEDHTSSESLDGGEHFLMVLRVDDV